MKMRMLKYQSIDKVLEQSEESFSYKHTFIIPAFSHIRKIDYQKGGYADLDTILTMWCEVDPQETRNVDVEIMVIPTGGMIDDTEWYFFDTIFIEDMVFHVYEKDTSTPTD